MTKVIRHGGVLFSLLFFYALLGAVYGNAHLLSSEGVLLLQAHAWKLAALGAFGVLVFSLFRKSFTALQLRLDIALLALGFFALTDVAARRFGFFPSGTSAIEFWYLGISASALLYLLPTAASSGKLFTLPLLVVVQILIAGLFLMLADGRLLFSDDHPSFLYRLHLLKEHFPSIPFYNPQWNGGYSAREFFPSGVLNVYFLSLPFLWWAGDLSVYENASVYTLLIPYLFIFLIPFSVYLAARVMKVSKAAAVVAALLALGPSTGFFEWLLKYGTLGFSVSIGLIPLCFALSFRLSLEERQPQWRDVLLLLLVASLTLMWTLSSFAFLPLVLVSLYFFRHCFLGARGLKLLGFVLLFLLLNGSWILTFLQESNVASFLSANTLPGSDVTHFDGEKRAAAEASMASEGASHSIKKAVERFRELAAKLNPLLLILFLPGLALLSDLRLRIVLGSSILWLLLLAMFGEDIKPQLELRRMILPAGFLMCIPVAQAVVALFDFFTEELRGEARGPRRLLAFFSLSALLGCLVLSSFTVASVYLNRSEEKFVFSSGLSKDLSQAIAEHGGEGRTFFLGFILQELDATWWAAQDGGHIAPLAAFSGKPMYASDFYHTRWSTVDPIPASYRARGRDGIEEFLDLVNATAVVSFKREWAKYCKENERYQEVFKGGRFRVFTRDSPGTGPLLEGKGSVKELKDGLEVTLDSQRLLIKYRYLPKLRVDDPEVKLSSQYVFTEELGGGKTNDVEFVVLETKNPAKTVRLSY